MGMGGVSRRNKHRLNAHARIAKNAPRRSHRRNSVPIIKWMTHKPL
jgi:hypothetical protein